MTRIRSMPVPVHSLLDGYSGSGAYVDCFVTEVTGVVTHAQFVEAFYTTPLFRLERLLLGLLISRPSTDDDVGQVAEGKRASFAAWRVESRAQNEVLLSAGQTRSWLMVSSSERPAGGTRLLFGSVVMRRPSAKPGGGTLGAAFHALLGFHQLYARALLLSASLRLSKRFRPRGRAAR